MQIVIDIPEERFRDIQRIAEVQRESNHFKTAEQIVANGTPLSKGYGRLIDADRLKEVFMRNTGYDYHDLIDIAPTIIEADKENILCQKNRRWNT